MERAQATEFKFTTAERCPTEPRGVAFTTEPDGSTGIYTFGDDGKLWPARTVSRDDPKRHDDIVTAWAIKYTIMRA